MQRSRIALEAGVHSPWVSRVLSELGYEVIVAHAILKASTPISHYRLPCRIRIAQPNP